MSARRQNLPFGNRPGSYYLVARGYLVLAGFASLTGSRRLRQTVISCTCEGRSDYGLGLGWQSVRGDVFSWQAIVRQSCILRVRDSVPFLWPYLSLFDSWMVRATGFSVPPGCGICCFRDPPHSLICDTCRTTRGRFSGWSLRLPGPPFRPNVLAGYCGVSRSYRCGCARFGVEGRECGNDSSLCTCGAGSFNDLCGCNTWILELSQCVHFGRDRRDGFSMNPAPTIVLEVVSVLTVQMWSGSLNSRLFVAAVSLWKMDVTSNFCVGLLHRSPCTKLQRHHIRGCVLILGTFHT